MSWVKLDDGFYDNPKILAVGLAAAGLYAAGLSYAARKLTDGFVPEVAVSMLTSGEEDGNDLPKFLVTHGLWSVVPGGYQIHDFLDYNPPASKVKAERAAAKERMRGVRSRDVRPNISRSSGDVREMFGNSVPVPVPVPVPKSVSKKTRHSGLDVPSSPTFDAFWEPYPKKRHKPDARRAWKQVAGDAQLDAILAGLERWKASEGWQRGFIEDPATFLRQRQWEDPVPTVPHERERDDSVAAIGARLQARLEGRR